MALDMIAPPSHNDGDMGPERIRTIREAMGMNRSQFGRHLGAAYKTVRKWETGVNKPHRIFVRELEYLEHYLKETHRLKGE